MPLPSDAPRSCIAVSLSALTTTSTARSVRPSSPRRLTLTYPQDNVNPHVPTWDPGAPRPPHRR